ncbi:toll-like receptor 3 [Mytilus edulis]|uniref:toll-like receptor 3 n=1 Tax=Mytilus edulis TaxID=6550 RepID=UPI0039EF7BD9
MLFIYSFIYYLLPVLCSSNCKIKETNMGNHTTITADCSNMGLVHVPQNLPRNITALDLSRNDITGITNEAFVNYKNLLELNLNSNKISLISNSSFKGLGNLQSLEMADNCLNPSEMYTIDLFMPLKKLNILNIRRNMDQPTKFSTIFMYPDQALGVLQQLTQLSIDLMPKPKFGQGFKLLQRLQRIEFQSCYVVSLTNETFKFFSSSVETLLMQNCRLNFVRVETGSLLPFPELKVVDFSDTFMHLKQALLLLNPYTNKNMSTINFHHVSDVVIDNKEFPYSLIVTTEMTKYLQTICVENLDLSQNGIVDYVPGSLFNFRFPECIQHLSVRANRFTIISNKIQLQYLNNFTRQASRLKTWDNSYNVVSYPIPKENPISADFDNPSDFIFYFPKSVEKVDNSYLMTNDLPIIYLVPFNSSLKYIDISYALVSGFMLFESDSKNHPPNLETLIDSGCDYSYIWQEFGRFPYNNLKTFVWTDCNLNEGIKAHPKDLFRHLNSVETLNISENNIWYFSDNLLDPIQNLSFLDVSKNLLQSIPIQLINHLKIKTLDVRNNLLTGINLEIRNWLDQMQTMHLMSLFLAGNAFECSCNNIHLIRWLQTTDVKLDSRSYNCVLPNGSNSNTLEAYNSISDLFAYCESSMWLTLATTLLSTGFIIAILLVLYNKRWKIMFTLQGIINRVVEQKFKRQYTYDVYISYEGNAVYWIKETLVSKLEGEWGLNMCIRERDFLAGISHADNEAAAIKESRCIIFVITPGYTLSPDRTFEINRAQYERIRSNLETVIVLTKDIKITDVPRNLSYIWNYVYLIEWEDEEQFSSDVIWEKLKLLLIPRSQY